MTRVSCYHPHHQPVEVTVDAEAIEFLIATGWLDEEDSDNPWLVGCALQEYLDFSATLLQ